jgi:transposase
MSSPTGSETNGGADARRLAANKAIVQRLVDEVRNGGNLDPEAGMLWTGEAELRVLVMAAARTFDLRSGS